MDRLRSRPLAEPYLAGGRRYALRTPVLADFATWREVRLRHAARLAPAFGSSEHEWAVDSSPEAWAEWLTSMRSAAFRGAALPAVVVEQADSGERVVGELGVCAVDPITRTGEFYAWSVAQDPTVVPWAASNLVLRAFDAPLHLDRVVAPVAEVNPGPSRALHRMGWARKAVRRALRTYDGAPEDHGIWVLENEPAVRRALEGLAR